MTIPAIAILLLLLVTVSLANEKDDKAEEESLAMVILLSAGSLAWSFFRLVWAAIYSVLSLLLLPVYYILGFFWRNLVARPFALFLHITHALYPVAMYCLAAVCCGTIIGGCAGFAAEAVSTFTIRTTWGRQERKKPPAPIQYPQHYDDDTASYISEVSSQWDPAFFGEHQNKGKERAVVDSWRQSLEPMYMSSARDEDPEEPLDDWAWEDDDDDDVDEFPRLRRRSVVR